MAIAAMGVTKPAAGVTPTKPQTAPEIIPNTVGLPFLTHSAAIHPKVAVAAAVTSLFSPFNIYVKAAAPKSISFWQFYGPGGGSKL